VHVTRSPEWSDGHSTGNWVRDLSNWRVMLGIDGSSWSFSQGENTLEIAEELEELAGKIPAGLYAIVAELADEPAVEDLDL
jgi:EXLDI family protein